MVLLQLCRWKFPHKDTLAQYSTELEFFHKIDKFAFWATIWGVRDNVHTSFIACWKAHGRLPIRDNWTFFASSYGSDVLSSYWSKWAFFKGVGQFTRKVQVEGDTGHLPLTSVGIRKREWPFYVMSKYRQYILSFCHKTRVWRTADTENYDAEDRASIAASCDKKEHHISTHLRLG